MLNARALRRLAVLFALLVSGLPLEAARAQELARVATNTDHATAIEQARAQGEEAVRSGLPGLSIAVGVAGRVVWAEGFGWADLEQRVPVRSVTRFRVGSVSKPMTAAAIGLLMQTGSLDVDAPVQKYVESFPRKPHPITTRQLAGHVAGIRHYQGDEFASSRRYETVAEGLEIFQDDPLLFEPGTRYSYSSYGWNLISAVVESAAEVEFLAYVQTEIFDRLGMIHTVPDHNHLIVPDRARPYERTEDGRLVNAPYVDNSYKWAGGGFLSTPEDMVRFGMAHLGEGFLEASTLDELFTSQTTADGVETGYGMGWRTGELQGQPVHHHSGGSVGGTTQLRLYPQAGVVVALVSNLSNAKLPSADRIAGRFMR